MAGSNHGGALVDASAKTRAGEELDLDALTKCLTSAWGPAAVREIAVEQFPSGHSNLTYLLRLTDSAGASRELVLRRPPYGNKVKTAHDMGREHRLLTALHPHFDKAPKPLLYSEDESVLGAPFYVMDRITGVILRRKLPAGLSLDAGTLSALADRFIDTLVELHELPYEKIGLESFGKPSGYVERQVSGWSKRYLDAKTDEIDAVERVAAWLAANQPTSSGASLIHNDFKYDNVVLDPAICRTSELCDAASVTSIIGVLDWEMSTIGDPMMDLATALSYWIQADDPAPLQTYTFGPTNLPGSPTRAALLEKYAARRPGAVPDDMRFYNAFALFKNAVVAQQIYARWKRGATQDPRFEMMIFAVRMLADTAENVIATGKF